MSECSRCDGSGNCPRCDGSGKVDFDLISVAIEATMSLVGGEIEDGDCPVCDGSGNCPSCS